MAYYVIVCSSPTVPLVPSGQVVSLDNCPVSLQQWVEIPSTVELKMPQAHSTDLIITFSLFWGIVVSIGLLAFLAGVVVKFIWHSSVRS